MEKLKKDLKAFSLIVLAFAALTIVKLATDVFLGMEVSASDGAPAETVAIMKIVMIVIAVIFLLPQLYVGFKGLSVAKNPDASKGHIVWAKIIIVFCFIGAIYSGMDIIKGGNVGDAISGIATNIVDAFIYFEFVKHATAVYKECQIQ